MGEIIYGAGESYEFDDRALAHVQEAVGAKLRRQEAFYLSWRQSDGTPEQRVSLWLAPSIALQFHYLGSRTATLNPSWLRAMELTATGDGGMFVLDEEDAEGYLNARRRPESI
ncbi:DUF7882 family protein [Microterricola pindariensis]|uniref:DUF7882 domain-containing protein n=1 Tax=Microterricola pindariensis TaxID=478010 RepID=A0ABX5AV38_9MICO|nr:hypothetical protein [Microterricola pindariensis]PPL17617.1 hypothetical protein GY24_11135 [Microterricola pindariensis]